MPTTSVDDQLGEKRLVGQFIDDYLGQLATELLDHAFEQVVGQWPLYGHVLHRNGDRVCLEVADPDRQVAWRGLLLEHDYPPVVGHIDADALDEDFDHRPLLLVRRYCMRWAWTVRKGTQSPIIQSCLRPISTVARARRGWRAPESVLKLAGQGLRVGSA